MKNIIRQNKKAALQEFLFGSQESITPQNGASFAATEIQNDLIDKIESLENQVFSLQRRIIDLETKLENPKDALSGTLDAPDDKKISQQDAYSLKPNMGSYLTEMTENTERINYEVRELERVDSDMLSEASKIPLKPLLESQQYDRSSNQNQAQNRPHFKTLAKIPEEEKIEIIKLGFQLQAEGKISLKKYYEGTEEYSLFQHKGYNIKYESIRRTKLYQQLK